MKASDQSTLAGQITEHVDDHKGKWTHWGTPLQLQPEAFAAGHAYLTLSWRAQKLLIKGLSHTPPQEAGNSDSLFIWLPVWHFLLYSVPTTGIMTPLTRRNLRTMVRFPLPTANDVPARAKIKAPSPLPFQLRTLESLVAGRADHTTQWPWYHGYMLKSLFSAADNKRPSKAYVWVCWFPDWCYWVMMGTLRVMA